MIFKIVNMCIVMIFPSVKISLYFFPRFVINTTNVFTNLWGECLLQRILELLYKFWFLRSCEISRISRTNVMSLLSIEFSKKYGKRTNKMKQFVFKTLKLLILQLLLRGKGKVPPRPPAATALIIFKVVCR